MLSALEALKNMDVASSIFTVLVLILVIKFIWELLDWFIQKLGISTRRTRDEEKQQMQIDDLTKSIQNIKEEIDVGRESNIALLRSAIVDDYNRYTEKGWASLETKSNFDNNWKLYHEKLNANTVSEQLHEDFMALPIKKNREG